MLFQATKLKAIFRFCTLKLLLIENEIKCVNRKILLKSGFSILEEYPDSNRTFL